MKTKFIIIISLAAGGMGVLGSCTKYLDQKPNQAQVVPSTLSDVAAILNNPSFSNYGDPYDGESAADNYYMTYTAWQAITRPSDIQTYVWEPGALVYDGEWTYPYEDIFYTNQALETLGQISPSAAQQSQWNSLEGTAWFYRGFHFYQLAQIFAEPYDSATAATDLGIPLRLTPDVTAPTVRSSVQQTYNQIIKDLLGAEKLLPVSIQVQDGPGKAAACAALARTYLAVGDYTDAFTWADSCLQLNSTLLNYNTLTPSAYSPVPRFNSEVLFDCSATSDISLLPSNAKVDSNLYSSYDSNDLRKTVFFSANGDGSYAFKGSYDGFGSSAPFVGLVTDEVYLVRAECYARVGNTAAALSDLNTLLQTRWVQGTFTPFTVSTADSALALILTERRKELLFRASRWTDLRRLNKDNRFAVTLTRNLNGQTYTLPPNDPRYTLLIPPDIMARVDIPQTPR